MVVSYEVRLTDLPQQQLQSTVQKTSQNSREDHRILKAQEAYNRQVYLKEARFTQDLNLDRAIYQMQRSLFM